VSPWQEIDHARHNLLGILPASDNVISLCDLVNKNLVESPGQNRGQLGLRFVLSEDNALLFAPRIVKRWLPVLLNVNQLPLSVTLTH